VAAQQQDAVVALAAQKKKGKRKSKSKRRSSGGGGGGGGGTVPAPLATTPKPLPASELEALSSPKSSSSASARRRQRKKGSRGHSRGLSVEMKHVAEVVEPGLRDARASVFDGGAQTGAKARERKGSHERHRSTGATEAARLIQAARRMKAEQEDDDDGGDDGDGDSHLRSRSLALDELVDADMITSAPCIENVPGPQNAVEKAFAALLGRHGDDGDGASDVERLREALMGHRARLGGLAIAPLRDLVAILGVADDAEANEAMSPFLSAAQAHGGGGGAGGGHTTRVSFLGLDES
jgi:hypothetical protein